MKQIWDLTQDDREEAIKTQLLAGNMPPSLRKLLPVTLTANIGGKKFEAELNVMPDYLSIGNDKDYVRIPMWSATAQTVADSLRMRLPTQKIAQAIYDQSEQLPFKKRTPGPLMETTAEFAAADAEHPKKWGVLLSGHKKDTVLSNQRGWHAGKLNWVSIFHPKIQPVKEPPHFHRFSDYSQGIRLVASTVRYREAGGEWKEMPYDEMLADPKLSALLSGEGPIKAPLNRYPTDRRAGQVIVGTKARP